MVVKVGILAAKMVSLLYHHLLVLRAVALHHVLQAAVDLVEESSAGEAVGGIEDIRDGVLAIPQPHHHCLVHGTATFCHILREVMELVEAVKLGT